jgi:2-polyprenyl-3-methyl-5-hydroxy-6-metoxy-1,4-benzoquinol methylase
VIVLSRENEVWDVPGHLQHLMEHWDFTRGRHKAIIDIVVNMITTDSVLDVACGIGFLFHEIKSMNKNIKYLGMDNSSTMLEDAYKRFPENRELFVHGDIYNMNNFEIYPTITAIDILMHLPDPLDLPIQEMWKHTGHELIFTARVDKTFIYYMDYSGDLPLPEGKFLISRADLPILYDNIFKTLDGVEKIEFSDYDSSSRIYRLVKKHV